jgi:TetR/AcrR family transcriptional regulator
MQTRLPTEERQAEIVATALRLARACSPALITTSDIAAAIGVTQGTVFKHFPSKDAIWLAAMGWVRQTLLHTLETAASHSATPLDALSAMFHAHVEFVVAHPGVPRFIFHELQQANDSAAKREVRALLQAYRKLLLSRLAQAAEHQQVRTGLDLDAAATSFIGLIQGLVMQSMLTGRHAAMRQQADAIFVLYRRGLGETR